MAKSSGHFGKGGVGYFAHNDRTSPTKNAIFSDEKNECSLSSKEAFKIYRDELKTRSQAYTNRTNQKLQKNTATHRSLIINLNSNHKLEDLKPIKEYLEKQLDTKVLQIAIHRDEGHIDENGKAVKNYHAHFEMMGLDSLGFSLAQHQNTKNKTRADRLDSKFYTKFQDFLSQTLQMERGQKNSKTKRLDTYEYKHHAERTAEKVKEVKQELSYDFKEFQKKITSLETENTELKKQLHKLNSEIKNTKELELKNQKIEELQKHMKKYEATFRKLAPEAKSTNEVLAHIAHNESEMAQKLSNAKKTINTLIELKADVVAQNLALKEKIEKVEKNKKIFLDHFKAPQGATFWGFLKEKFEDLTAKVKELTLKVTYLETENKALKEENQALKADTQSKDLPVARDIFEVLGDIEEMDKKAQTQVQHLDYK